MEIQFIQQVTFAQNDAECTNFKGSYMFGAGLKTKNISKCSPTTVDNLHAFLAI